MNELSDAEKRVVKIIGWGMALVIVSSSVLHHFFPSVLDVPPNDGVPHTGYLSMFLLDLVPITMGALCFYHAKVRYGLYKAMMFLGGSFFFTGLAENGWILLGRYKLITNFYSQFSEVSGTYYFTRGFFWWGEMPAVICLAWFFIAYACVHIMDLLKPKSGIMVKSAWAGFLAMSFDLWMDPVQAHPAWQSWKWISNETIKIFSIPLSNFMGWFLFIFLFAVAFDKLPKIVEKWGVTKGTWMFFGLLLLLKVGMLVGLMAYGLVAMTYVNPPINLTIWGI